MPALEVLQPDDRGAVIQRLAEDPVLAGWGIGRLDDQRQQRAARAGRVDHRFDPGLDVVQAPNRVVGLSVQDSLELGQVLAELGPSPAAHAERLRAVLDATARPYQRESGHRHRRQTSVFARLTDRRSLPQ